jgi:hypothetical protein
MTRLALATLSLSVLCRCGALQADPCSAPTTGVSLSSKALADLGASATTLDCAGDVDGRTLACAGAAEARAHACDDGFGVVIAASDATLLLHFRNDGRWTAGARLLGGPDATGAMTVAGLSADLQPPAGTTQAGAFDLLVGAAKLNGTYTTTW